MNKTEKELKELVKAKYNEIAGQERADNQASCCGAGVVSQEVYNIMTDDYNGMEGYEESADLGLGCGLPTQFAQIKNGDTVVDLGSGAGNDCFVARRQTGDSGKVIGVDFSDVMIQKARSNAEKLGYNNVEFREGDIESMPLNDAIADVVVSNCVLNLVPNKLAVMQEIFRVLKPGGHFSISDIVLKGSLPKALQEDGEMYAGCVAGAIQKDQYLDFIKQVGFQNITIQKEKLIQLPEDILRRHLNEGEVKSYQHEDTGIFSISVFAVRPGSNDPLPETSNVSVSCEPGSGCC